MIALWSGSRPQSDVGGALSGREVRSLRAFARSRLPFCFDRGRRWEEGGGRGGREQEHEDGEASRMRMLRRWDVETGALVLEVLVTPFVRRADSRTHRPAVSRLAATFRDTETVHRTVHCALTVTVTHNKQPTAPSLFRCRPPHIYPASPNRTHGRHGNGH